MEAAEGQIRNVLPTPERTDVTFSVGGCLCFVFFIFFSFSTATVETVQLQDQMLSHVVALWFLHARTRSHQRPLSRWPLCLDLWPVKALTHTASFQPDVVSAASLAAEPPSSPPTQRAPL